jgi:hypothetical protein
MDAILHRLCVSHIIMNTIPALYKVECYTPLLEYSSRFDHSGVTMHVATFRQVGTIIANDPESAFASARKKYPLIPRYCLAVSLCNSSKPN